MAQMAATLGREFSYELLAAAATLDEATLQAEMAKLVRAEILYSKGKPPALQLYFQTCSAGGCGIQLAGKNQATAVPQASCGVAGGTVSTDGRHAAGVSRSPFHGSESGGEGGWLLAEGRASLAGPVGERGGDRPSDKRTGFGRYIPQVPRTRCERVGVSESAGGGIPIGSKDIPLSRSPPIFERARELRQRTGETGPDVHQHVGQLGLPYSARGIRLVHGSGRRSL